jgi:hypothetical protein
MSRGKGAGILHVAFEVPELLQSHIRYVDDVVRLTDGSLGMPSTGYGRAQGKDELDEVLVERKETKKFAGHRGRHRRVFTQHCLVVCRHVPAVQVGDLEDVDGYATLVPPTGPLRILWKCNIISRSTSK